MPDILNVTTILAAIIGFLGKSIWDIYWRRRAEIDSIARQRRIAFLEGRLKNFYWPIYIRLQKDNIVWKKLRKRTDVNDSLLHRVGENIDNDYLLPNHEEIVKIIEHNMHLAQLDPDSEECLLKYIRHVAIYKAIRTLGIRDIDPSSLGEPYPTEIFQIISNRTTELQELLNKLVRHNIGI